MNEEHAINLVQQQFEEAKRWQHILQGQQSSEEMLQAMTGIHALGIVLELAKKQVDEELE